MSLAPPDRNLHTTYVFVINYELLVPDSHLKAVVQQLGRAEAQEAHDLTTHLSTSFSPSCFLSAGLRPRQTHEPRLCWVDAGMFKAAVCERGESGR